MLFWGSREIADEYFNNFLIVSSIIFPLYFMSPSAISYLFIKYFFFFCFLNKKLDKYIIIIIIIIIMISFCLHVVQAKPVSETQELLKSNLYPG